MGRWTDARCPFIVEGQPLFSDGEKLLLVRIIDDPASAHAAPGAALSRDASRIAELERELEAARAELEEIEPAAGLWFRRRFTPFVRRCAEWRAL